MADQTWINANAPPPPQGSAATAGWFATNAPSVEPPESKGTDYNLFGFIPIHVPPEAPPRRDSVVVGWGNEGSGISPEELLGAGYAGRAITGATKAGGALAGVKETLAQASPIIKYEAARSILRAAKVPDFIATPLGMLISGYKRGGATAAETAAETQVSTPGYPRLTKTPAPPARPPSAEAGPYSEPGFPRMTRTAAPPTPPPSPEGAPYSDPGFPRMTRTEAPPAPPPSEEAGPYSEPGYPRLKRMRKRASRSGTPAPAAEGPYGSAPGFPRMTRTEAPISPPEIDFPTSEEINASFERAYPPQGAVQKYLVGALNDRIRQWLGGP